MADARWLQSGGRRQGAAVTLDNGPTFVTGDNAERNVLRPGVRAMVIWENRDDRPVALKVAPAL